MKKFLMSILVAFMLFTITPTRIFAEENKDDVSYIKSKTVIENGEIFHITYNTLTNEIAINGEKLEMEVIDSPKPYTIPDYTLFRRGGPTINWSSGRTFNMKVPWKTGISSLAAAIGALVAGYDGASAGASIVGIVTADGGTLYVSFTNYLSKETYHSDYSNIDYNKAINKNITFTYDGKKVFGPQSGSWYDPVR